MNFLVEKKLFERENIFAGSSIQNFGFEISSESVIINLIHLAVSVWFNWEREKERDGWKFTHYWWLIWKELIYS